MSPHLVDSNSYVSILPLDASLSLTPRQLPKTAVTCTPAKRRRVVHNTARTARRRQSARHECPFPYADGANVFDKLSWISQLHEETDCLNPWDIADLSQLPIEQPDFHRSSGIGPVRSRKSSLRSDPLSYGTPDLQDIGFTPLPQRSASPEPSPPVFPLFDREALDPRTPPPRDTFNPEDVSFFNLKPVLPMDDDTY
ncbi:hypothetical protein K474DRAFT_1591009 [Panus rudis PR-1116 ss-1]|nr:hypothetical protein K474DRAFT_1591009 [Panus rudis PR-1116 ss-1]